MRRLLSWGGLALVFVLFLAFNVLSSTTLTRGRIDLTENKLFTLSQGTKNVLAKVSDPISLRFYFSKKLAAEQAPGVVSYAQRVRELLEEYVSHSGGKLTLEVADPEPYSETEERAAQYGLKGVPATAGGEMLYFGLAGTSASSPEDEVIPFFQPDKEDSLEYDITRLVYNLSNPKKKTIGLVTSLPMDGDPMARMMNPRARPQEPWIALEQLRQTFDVKVIPPTAEKLEDNLDVLVLVHPQNLAPGMLYSIDQFVLNGGNVVAFIDPYCVAQPVREDPQNPMQSMMADRSSSLGVLGEAWGIEMSKDDIVGDRDLALRVSQGQGQPPIDSVVYIGVRSDKDALDKSDFTTSQLKSMNLGFAGVLRKRDGATTTITPLIETTKNSMRIEKSKVQFQASAAELLESFQAGGEKMMLAARINGTVKTAFPAGKPASAAESADAPTPLLPAESLKESKGPINVIVVADADMLADDMWVRVQNFLGTRIPQALADNGSFLTNVVDNLSGSNDLISLRSRGRSLRPFDKVADLRREAESKFRQKEKDLEAKLRDAEEKISKLQGNPEINGAVILTPEQQAEILKFRDERNKTKKELRRVKLELRKDIESLKTQLVVVVGFAVPLVVLVLGAIVWQIRRSKMKAARESALAS
ncbi:MAG: Gldg family protein [Planctomycetes bacterium]|nr:Gldg family protein [Planctomycetota bacterium]